MKDEFEIDNDNLDDNIDLIDDYKPKHAKTFNELKNENLNNDEIDDEESSEEIYDELIDKDINNNIIDSNILISNKLDNEVALDEKYLSHKKDKEKEEKVVINNYNDNSTKKKKKNNKIIYNILIILFATMLIICSIKIIIWFIDNKKSKNITEVITENIDIEEIEDDENTELINEDENKESDYWYYVKFPLINVDFKELKEKNSDTVGWINVNNTNINYPFVKTNDNEYYLNHSYDKTSNNAGWVFMDYRNNNDISQNKNTILYAHGMHNGTMFGSLNNTVKSNWYENKDNHIIRISTENENSLWQIFSIYIIKKESYYITTEFSTNDDYQNYLNTMISRSIYNFNTKVDTNDQILTLSTCYSDNERTVVQAKLLKITKK